MYIFSTACLDACMFSLYTLLFIFAFVFICDLLLFWTFISDFFSIERTIKYNYKPEKISISTEHLDLDVHDYVCNQNLVG